MLSRHTTRAYGGFLLMSFMILSVGCGGPNYKARATVKGKVTFAGKTLTVGNVMFTNKQSVPGSASIDTNGNYVMKDAPLGECTVTVSVPKMPMTGPGGTPNPFAGPGGAAVKGMKSVDPSGSGKSISIMGEVPTHIVTIPEKYSKPETSGLTYTVEKGEHTHNIDLKP
jgi:hypothetical protein